VPIARSRFSATAAAIDAVRKFQCAIEASSLSGAPVPTWLVRFSAAKSINAYAVVFAITPPFIDRDASVGTVHVPDDDQFFVNGAVV
jgi:hypothetical protein